MGSMSNSTVSVSLYIMFFMFFMFFSFSFVGIAETSDLEELVEITVDVTEVVKPEDISCLNDLLYSCPDWDSPLSNSPSLSKVLFLGWLLHESGETFAVHVPKMLEVLDENNMPSSYLWTYMSILLDNLGDINPENLNYLEIIKGDYDLSSEWLRSISGDNPTKVFVGGTNLAAMMSYLELMNHYEGLQLTEEWFSLVSGINSTRVVVNEVVTLETMKLFLELMEFYEGVELTEKWFEIVSAKNHEKMYMDKAMTLEYMLRYLEILENYGIDIAERWFTLVSATTVNDIEIIILDNNNYFFIEMDGEWHLTTQFEYNLMNSYDDYVMNNLL